jgi:uncharacterized protein YndB with AHSA1/START domain
MMLLLDNKLSLEAARWFDAPPRRLFEAWLHESWGEWLAPGAAWCTSSIVDPKPGGRFSVAMRMPDGGTTISGSYREITHPSRIVLNWKENCNDVDTTLVLAFRPVSEGTHLTLRQHGFANAPSRDRYRGDWTGRDGVFDKLGTFLARYCPGH